MLLTDKRILLIIGGGIAAYKCLELIRLITKAGGSVRAVLTDAGSQFVTPLSISALSGEKVYQSLFDLTDEAEMGHIQLSRDADLLVVAPATADLMAKLVGGNANDLASTVLLATDTPVLLAPAMNVRMWDHPATQRNVDQLKADGHHFIGPDEGAMACGEYGPGRMTEPEAILQAIADHFSSKPKPLIGRHILVTAGPTHEPIDPVRYIANRSSGQQGYAIARALSERGARVSLISGPVQLSPPVGVDLIQVESAKDMLGATQKALPADAAVMVAAVADWGTDYTDQKIKKTKCDSVPSLTLVENPDILKTISSGPDRPALVVGFAAETENVIVNARKKLDTKACDWIVANDVSSENNVMGGRQNTVHLITRDGIEDWPKMEKTAVADRLADRITDALTHEPSKE